MWITSLYPNPMHQNDEKKTLCVGGGKKHMLLNFKISKFNELSELSSAFEAY